jgi:hypothetical protein
MLRFIHTSLFTISIIFILQTVTGQTLQQEVSTDGGYQHVLCEPKQGLQPNITFDKNLSDWTIFTDYYLQTNFPRNTWIGPTNRVSAKLELWSTNGLVIPLKSADALAAFHAPAQTTVSDIMNNVHPSDTRGMKWLHITKAGQFEGVLPFSLQSAFGISFTNDYVFQITPFIYRADTNLDKATLVEFPPVKIKLMANGNVQKTDK